MGVSITGIGVISAIGIGVSENLHSLLNGISGIKPSKRFAGEGLLMAEVNRLNETLIENLGLPEKYYSRTSLLGLSAAREAWGQNEHIPSLKTGLISATSVGGMDITEGLYEEYLNQNKANFGRLKLHDSGNATEKIAQNLGISGYVNTMSTACSSGANAIMLGARMLEKGLLDRVLVGGVDPLTRFTINGFKSLMIYDSNWCRPFDESRSGLNLGEGAAYLLLESERSQEITGNNTLAYLTGWANAADAYHQTASSPDGIGAGLAMQNALNKAGLSSKDISYVNAHGTGTKNNDLSESVALKRIFEKGVPDFSSTKAFTGHTLAAAGAIEAVYAILSIQHGLIFPNLNFKKSIQEEGLIPATKLITGKHIKHVLSNSFGFGGNNSSLVFSGISSKIN